MSFSDFSYRSTQPRRRTFFDMPLEWSPRSGVRLRFGDIFNCEADWAWHSGVLPTTDLWYVIDGIGWLSEERSGLGRQAVRGGDLVLLRAQHSYRAGHDPQHPLSLVAVHFECLDDHDQAIQFCHPDTGISIVHADNGAFIQAMLLRTVRDLQEGHQDRAQGWFQCALMEIVEQGGHGQPSGRFGEQSRHIGQLCERIRRSPGAPLRVETLATELNLTPEHFSRLFRRVVGVPPRTFITRTRIDAARRLLLTSSYSIGRIADLLGYDSPFQFSRQFKARVGIAPKHFRNQGRSIGT